MMPAEYRNLTVKKEDPKHWRFLCPFHDDHNPSMTVNKSGQYAGYFRCWSCGAKGSPAAFARKMGQTPSMPFPPTKFKKTLSQISKLAPARLARLCVRYRLYKNRRVFKKLADTLGICPAVLNRFHVGFDGRAFCFPMVGADNELVGIRLRTLDGRKYSLKGGRNGLFVPYYDFNPRYPLFITEGESDAMAAFQMGFQAVGIPGKGQCKEILAGWMKEHGFRKAVIVSDNDSQGQTGAKDLAKYLAFDREFEVRIINPPKRYKDFREWFNAGAKMHEVFDRIDTAQYHIGAEIVNCCKRIKIIVRGIE